MKDRILVPAELQGRLEKLVRQRAAAAQIDESLARRDVERAVLQGGLAALEQRAEAEDA